jgi:glycosyltransferase involved in cell wall biosynthesis
MHIVCVHRALFPERIGGTYSYIHELYRRLAARGHDVDVIASTRKPRAGPPHMYEGMRIHLYTYRRVNPVFSTLQHLRNTSRIFSGIAAESPVDVLSIHESQLGYGLARSRAGKAVCQIATFHAPVFMEFRFNTAWEVEREPSALRRFVQRAAEPPLEHWQRRFETGVLEAADGIVILSEYTRSHIESNFPSIDPGKLRIIPSGVDTARFRPAEDRAAVRETLGIDADAIHLVTTRKLAPRMGLENLVRAMPAVLKAAGERGLKLSLAVCGSGPLRPVLEHLIREVNVEGSVRLAGRVSDDDLVRHYQAADLFVLPTVAMEGFGISTVEALSTNLPVIGTPAGATPEILGPIDERLLTDDTSVESLARGIISWLGWRDEDAGTTRYRDEALAKYTWDSVTDRVEAYYRERIEAFGRSPGAGARETETA